MYRTDRSSAPLGLAVVFLSLAIVPVSLRVAGYDVSISPSLSAAVEAWRGIAGVLGNSSQPVSDTELSLVKKYSFAEETPQPAEQPVAAELCSKGVNVETDVEESRVSIEHAYASTVAPVVQPKARAKARRSSASSPRVIVARSQRESAAELPVLVRTAASVKTRSITCAQREAARLRVLELVRGSHTLNPTLQTVQLRKDLQVFVKMKPIALLTHPRMPGCDGDQLMPGEPATEVFSGAGLRFGVGASAETELPEFFF